MKIRHPMKRESLRKRFPTSPLRIFSEFSRLTLFFHLPFAPSIFSFLILLVLPAANFAQAGAWSRQTSGSMAWLHTVFFFDQNRGLAAGSKGALLATDDGGTTWKARSRPTDDAVRDLYFADPLNGWIVCERNIYQLKSNDDSRTYLMKTTDAGQNWQRVKMRDADVNARVVRAVFSPSGRGWAFGEFGAVYKSSAGEGDWIRLNSPTRKLLLGGTFIDDYRGWLVGSGGTILQTSDGGETWNIANLANAQAVRFNATSFIDNRNGWAVGSGGSIYRTTNGGRTWEALSSGVSADLFDVKFLDAREGWAVGADGTAVYSADGGLTWATQPTNTTHPLERVFFTDRAHGWAVGFGGTILKYVSAEAPKLNQ